MDERKLKKIFNAIGYEPIIQDKGDFYRVGIFLVSEPFIVYFCFFKEEEEGQFYEQYIKFHIPSSKFVFHAGIGFNGLLGRALIGPSEYDKIVNYLNSLV